jgi:hypothetical protein
MKGAVDTGKLRPNRGRTNQKLYFAKLQLDRVAVSLADKSVFSWEAEALSQREAAIFHLYSAYISFLQELVCFYRLNGPMLTSEAIHTAMAAKGQVSPEISVLQSIEHTKDSWLSALLLAYKGCVWTYDPVPLSAPVFEPESEPVNERPESLGRAIGLVAVNQDEPLSPPDLLDIQSWHRELTQIIRGFRDEMEEW